MSYARQNATNNVRSQASKLKRAEQMKRVHDARVAGELKNASLQTVLTHNQMVKSVERVIQTHLSDNSEQQVVTDPSGVRCVGMAISKESNFSLPTTSLPFLAATLPEPTEIAKSVHLGTQASLEMTEDEFLSILCRENVAHCEMVQIINPIDLLQLSSGHGTSNANDESLAAVASLYRQELLSSLNSRQKSCLRFLDEHGELEQFIKLVSVGYEDSNETSLPSSLKKKKKEGSEDDGPTRTITFKQIS